MSKTAIDKKTVYLNALGLFSKMTLKHHIVFDNVDFDTCSVVLSVNEFRNRMKTHTQGCMYAAATEKGGLIRRSLISLYHHFLRTN